MQDLHRMYKEFEARPKAEKEVSRMFRKLLNNAAKKENTDWNEFRESFVRPVYPTAMEDLRLLEAYTKAELLDQGQPEKNDAKREYDDNYRQRVKDETAFNRIKNRINLLIENEKEGTSEQCKDILKIHLDPNFRQDISTPERRREILRKMDALEKAEKEAKIAPAQSQTNISAATNTLPQPPAPRSETFSSISNSTQQLLEAYARFCQFAKGKSEPKTKPALDNKQEKIQQILMTMAGQEPSLTELDKIKSLTAVYDRAVAIAATQHDFKSVAALLTRFNEAQERAPVKGDLANPSSSIPTNFGKLADQFGALGSSNSDHQAAAPARTEKPQTGAEKQKEEQEEAASAVSFGSQ